VRILVGVFDDKVCNSDSISRGIVSLRECRGIEAVVNSNTSCALSIVDLLALSVNTTNVIPGLHHNAVYQQKWIPVVSRKRWLFAFQRAV
jgi:hypothetical protein